MSRGWSTCHHPPLPPRLPMGPCPSALVPFIVSKFIRINCAIAFEPDSVGLGPLKSREGHLWPEGGGSGPLRLAISTLARWGLSRVHCGNWPTAHPSPSVSAHRRLVERSRTEQLRAKRDTEEEDGEGETTVRVRVRDCVGWNGRGE